MDRGMWGQFSGVEETFSYNPSANSSGYTQGFPSLLRRFSPGTWRCTYARRKSCFICLTSASTSWVELCHAWFGVSSRSACTQDLETFSYWKPLWCIHGSQEFEVYFHAEGVESQAEEMVGANKLLWYETTLSSRKGQCRSRRFEPKELCQYPHKRRISAGVRLTISRNFVWR